MRGALLFRFLLFCVLLRRAARAQPPLPVSVRQLPGIDVGAPRFLEENATWRFELALAATEGTLLVPLFRNRSAPPAPPLDACEGFVSLCCLWDLSAAFLNAQFAMYLHYLGACGLHAGQPSVDVLTDEPSSNALTAGAFAAPPPAVWCVAEHRCVLEVAALALREPWLTEDLGTVSSLNGRTVVDRRLDLTIAIVTPMLTPLVKITLSHHHLIFHDSNVAAPEDSNTRHHAFSHSCLEERKPEFALWRADVLALAGECLWFCEPGFVLHPATTDAGLRAARYAYACLPEPARAAVYGFRVLVSGGANITTGQLEAYQAEALTALQAALEAVLALPPGSSLLHLQAGGPDGALTVSVAVFLRDCTRNLSAQVLRIADALDGPETAVLFTANVLAALNTTPAADATPAALNTTPAANATPPVTVGVAEIAELRPCPPSPADIPLLAAVLAAAWGALLCLCAAYGLLASVRRLRERRARLLRRLAPVAQPAFDPRPRAHSK